MIKVMCYSRVILRQSHAQSTRNSLAFRAQSYAVAKLTGKISVRSSLPTPPTSVTQITKTISQGSSTTTATSLSYSSLQTRTSHHGDSQAFKVGH